jgi:hypothetical protein
MLLWQVNFWNFSFEVFHLYNFNIFPVYIRDKFIDKFSLVLGGIKSKKLKQEKFKMLLKRNIGSKVAKSNFFC